LAENRNYDRSGRLNIETYCLEPEAREKPGQISPPVSMEKLEAVLPKPPRSIVSINRQDPTYVVCKGVSGDTLSVATLVCRIGKE
jgi:hypothetical protein